MCGLSASASFEKAYAEHDLQLKYLGVGPAYDPLRSDPRFQELVRRVGPATRSCRSVNLIIAPACATDSSPVSYSDDYTCAVAVR